MQSPYTGRPDHTFWKKAVASLEAHEVDPVASVPFTISPADRIATAGSCFAQHISNTLKGQGYRYLVTEQEPGPGEADENYGVFPARFGNIYTVRQLLQLFDRAYDLFEPIDSAWRRPDGALVDPFRPRIQTAGFASRTDLLSARSRHLAAVRRMFEEADVFVFTLGLTEAWVSNLDEAAFPLAPGVAGSGENAADYRFENFRVSSMVDDMGQFIERFRVVNPTARIILTVSPVALVATYEDRHVLVSTTASKAALRTVADEITAEFDHVAYFPSYEIITGPHARGRFFEPDLRGVTPEGVQHVMSIFTRHFLNGEHKPERTPVIPTMPRPAPVMSATDLERLSSLERVVCDEEAIDA